MSQHSIGESTLADARRLMDSVAPIPGMMRTVYRCDCDDCGQLFLHQYTPFGLGHGARYNQCHCQLTQNRMHQTTNILEVRD